MATEPTPSDAGPRDETAGLPPAGAPPHTGPAPLLLDGSPEGRLLPHLIDRLRDPDLDRIAMAVSFVTKGGLARFLQPLEDALDRGAHVRILTTDYLAITDPDALTQLTDLAEGRGRQLEVRLFSGGSVALHPKAYIFWSSAGEAAAGYVGSSNLCASGIDGGAEWNVGVERVERLVAAFEALWANGRSKPLDEPDRWGDVATVLRRISCTSGRFRYLRTPRSRGGSESCGRWVSDCCFGSGAFSAGPRGGGPETFSVG